MEGSAITWLESSSRGKVAITTNEAKSAGELSREISREMVRLLKRYVGRGPTYARTYIHSDLVVIVFHDTMTTAEETLKEEHQEDRIRELRRTFQGAFRPEAIALIERALGKRVIAFLSDHAVDPDWAIEAFVLDNDTD